jgi:hypothetical protein
MGIGNETGCLIGVKAPLDRPMSSFSNLANWACCIRMHGDSFRHAVPFTALHVACIWKSDYELFGLLWPCMPYGSSVSMVTRLRIGRPDFDSREGQGRVQTGSGAHSAS